MACALMHASATGQPEIDVQHSENGTAFSEIARLQQQEKKMEMAT